MVEGAVVKKRVQLISFECFPLPHQLLGAHTTMQVRILIVLLISILDVYGIGAVRIWIAAENPTDMEFTYNEKNLQTPTMFIENDDNSNAIQNNYSELVNENTSNESMKSDKRSSRIHVYRRGCIRRNGACDHRPNDCCFSSSCRCNLWGSNCRCQRMGLFQKWG